MKAFVDWRDLYSMRARMTLVFAVLVAVLMSGVVAGVLHLERKRAKGHVEENLQLALERAQHEIAEDERNAPLLKLVQDAQGEIAIGGLSLLVVSGNRVLWRSQTQSPRWPNYSQEWAIKTRSRGPQTLVVAYRWGSEEKELRETALELVGLGILVVAATSILAWCIIGQTLSPIGRLAEQAQSATLEGISVRLLAPSSDAEMRHLTRTLNDLLSRLEKEAQARGHFYAAASHELRTPIQILLGELEVAQSRPRTIEEYAGVLELMHEGTERLATLVQDLLQLNALEMRQNLAPQERINCAFWLERALAQQSAAFKRRNLRVETHLMDVPINAPPLHVEILLRNLVENAAKYATTGSIVRVELGMAEGHARLQIYNACSLPQDESLNEWFTPFFRPDASRSSQTGGNGLGLAICRAVCLANGWGIELRRRDEGLCAQVEFPLAQGYDEKEETHKSRNSSLF